MTIGQQIKNLRTGLGLSQDQLADQTQLSLRTIQRVENGETDARGDTIVRIAKALNLPVSEIYGLTEQEDNSYLAVFNLSALSFIIFPLLGILVPLVLWLLKRDKIRDLDNVGKKMLNFQISWFLLLSVMWVWMAMGAIFRLELWYAFVFGVPSLVIAMLVLYVFNIALIAMNTVRCAKAKKVIYQPAIPFLR